MAAATPGCRLYLRLPTQLSDRIQSSIAQVLARPATSASCVLLCSNASGPDAAPLDETWAEQILQLAQAHDVACLVEGDVELARKIGADGVHIPADAGLYARARERLGADRIVGVGCRQSRHYAMTLAELGADYVAFGPAAHNLQAKDELAELVAWWAGIFVVPCVAFGVASAEEARQLADLGADFVAPVDSLWQAPDAADRLAEFAAALGRTRSAA